MSENNNNRYESLLSGEASYWGESEKLLEESGLIPLWFDLRRGQHIPIPKHLLRTAAFRVDPLTHELIMGKYIRKLLRTATAKPGKVIDIGCGSGWLSLELARSGMHVTGYDISAPRIETARRYAEESRTSKDPLLHGDFGNLDYKVADLNKITFEKESVDVVVSASSLHHIKEIEHLLGQIHHSLKPDGQFIFIEHIGLSFLEFVYSKITPRNLTRSPFEDAAGENLLRLTEEMFHIEKYETFSILLRAVGVGLKTYKWPDTPKKVFLRTLSAVDRLIIMSGLSRGEFVYLHAVKK